MNAAGVEIAFPCDHVFKAFFSVEASPAFRELVLQAVNAIVPCAEDALRERQSGRGSYTCLSIVVRLYNREQLDAIYAALRKIDGLVYLL